MKNSQRSENQEAIQQSMQTYTHTALPPQENWVNQWSDAWMHRYITLKFPTKSRKKYINSMYII